MNNPLEVNKFISNIAASNAYEHNLIKVYGYYVRNNKLEWDRPKYRFERKPIKIPSEENVNLIIEKSSKMYAVIFTVLKETGAMPYELSKVSLSDIDLDKGLLSVQGFKGHASRTFKLRPNTVAKLKWYVAHYGNKAKLFPGSEYLSKAWRRNRNSVAKQNPILKSIHLYHLRHFFASTFYHRYRDPILLMQMMGHKDLQRVMTYVQLLANPSDDEWTCKTARTIDECKALIESGFE